MGSLFKWNMFFTSFLPLWISIIISDIWSVVDKMKDFFLGYSSLEMIKKQPIPVVKNCLWMIKIEGLTIIILLINIIVSICLLNKEIDNQDQNTSPLRGKIVRAKRANKLSAEFLFIMAS